MDTRDFRVLSALCLLLRIGFSCEFIIILFKEYKDNAILWEWTMQYFGNGQLLEKKKNSCYAWNILLCCKTIQESLDVSCRWVDF